MLPPANDLEATWSFIEEGITQIMEHLEEGLSPKRYLMLYTAVYNYCARSKDLDSDTIGEDFAPSRGKVIGEKIYLKTVDYLKRHLEGIRNKLKDLDNDDLLVHYLIYWNRYTAGANCLQHLFEYLNRYYIKYEVVEGQSKVYDIYTLTLVCWREEIIEPLHENLQSSIILLIRRIRSGESIESSRLKSILSSFVFVGQTDPNGINLQTYKKCFEDKLLESSKEFYNKESEQIFGQSSLKNYVRFVKFRLQNESNMVAKIFHESTKEPLIKACESIMIGKYKPIFQQHFLEMLKSEQYTDLEVVYDLLSKLPSGLDPLFEKYKTFVVDEGLNSLSDLKLTDEVVEPSHFLSSFIKVHRKQSEIVSTAFNNDQNFSKALDKACRIFLNYNKFCNTPAKAAEILAKFTDTVLQNKDKSWTIQDIDSNLDDLIGVFQYLEDKDKFQAYYRSYLSNRLVGKTFFSEEAEINMLEKLKTICGYDYTNKLQRMFHDIDVSNELNSAFNHDLELKNNLPPFETNFLVLTTSFWPLHTGFDSVILSSQIYDIYASFQKFYHSQHSGRKLACLYNYCNGELIFTAKNNVNYTLQLSTYQMIILLLFNDVEVLSFDVALEVLANSALIATSVLESLVNNKLLILANGNIGEQDSSYILNKDFQCENHTIDIAYTIDFEASQEITDLDKTVEEDRKMILQSIIVQLIKSEKVMSHENLVGKIMDRVSSRFSPKTSNIQKAIDALIEKEYIEQNENDDVVQYTYLT